MAWKKDGRQKSPRSPAMLEGLPCGPFRTHRYSRPQLRAGNLRVRPAFLNLAAAARTRVCLLGQSLPPPTLT